MSISESLPVVRLCRVAVDKPHRAVEFLHQRAGGVMDNIAHFWDRLGQSPALGRSDLHLLLAGTASSAAQVEPSADDPQNPSVLPGGLSRELPDSLSGAMLYVPKAYRADVFALDSPTAAAFTNYILAHATNAGANGQTTPEVPAEAGSNDDAAANTGAKPAIDFLTGGAEGIAAMVPTLLRALHRRTPAKQLVNMVMHFPANAPAPACPAVRMAREGDAPALNRWRKMYMEERGILFDADVEAWIQSHHVFVYEHENQVAALAKFDLVLDRLVELGGIYTFPEFRGRGFAKRIVSDLVNRVRDMGKTPALQSDESNSQALGLYSRLGWVQKGKLGRVWLTGA